MPARPADSRCPITSVLEALSQCLVFHLMSVSGLNEILNACTCVLESTEGSESRGAPEKENERTGVVAAPAFSHHPLPHPQQTWKGTV